MPPPKAMRHIIDLNGAVGRHPDQRLARPASFRLDEGDHIAIMGPNGSGKNLLIDLLTGKNALAEGSLAYDFGPGVEPRAYGNIIHLTFDDALGSVDKPYYYQQRFNSQDRDESPLVVTVLSRALAGGGTGSGLTADEARAAGHGLTQAEAQAAGAERCEAFTQDPLIDTFGMRPLLQKRMVLLSSGEMRRYQLFKNLLRRPRVLIVDNPFIGLDAPMRQQLSDFFQLMVEAGQTHIIMVLSMLDDVPPYITHVVRVDEGVVEPRMTRAEYLAHWQAEGHSAHPMHLAPQLRQTIADLPHRPTATLTTDGSVTDTVIDIRDLSLPLPDTGRVLYGGLTWAVGRGERWALQGRNGSGKSTLLSLICADHPAAYACDISLFGRRRGTGESIWDIKRHIGFVSPEFHRSYKENRPALDIVASGLYDTVGLYRRPSPEQAEACLLWMRVFGIEALRDRRFLTLSSGEQRLCLLARAFVKDPALLILDEPLHGLDTYRRQLVREVIEAFCQRPDKTLIMVSHYVDELPPLIDRHLTL